MALTYRSVKGSALTIDELDNNFRHFTGSHAVTGSYIVSGSITVSGSLKVSGSGTFDNVGPFTQFGTSAFTGSSVFFGDFTQLGSDNTASIQSPYVEISGLPTSDPAQSGRIYNDGGTLKVSAG